MKITDINVTMAQNGVIVRVSKETETDDPDKPTKFDSETMIFKSMNEAGQWLSGNAPEMKKKWEGKISETLSNS